MGIPWPTPALQYHARRVGFLNPHPPANNPNCDVTDYEKNWVKTVKDLQ